MVGASERWKMEPEEVGVPTGTCVVELNAGALVTWSELAAAVVESVTEDAACVGAVAPAVVVASSSSFADVVTLVLVVSSFCVAVLRSGRFDKVCACTGLVKIHSTASARSSATDVHGGLLEVSIVYVRL